MAKGLSLQLKEMLGETFSFVQCVSVKYKQILDSFLLLIGQLRNTVKEEGRHGV